MNIPYGLMRPLLFKFDAETAHAVSIRALKYGVHPRVYDNPPSLKIKVAGLRFLNPLGMAAGYDKNAEVMDPLLRMGFGFVRSGTVTPRAQPGNPRPRMYRLVEDEAVINRLGFNNQGLEAALHRFRTRAWNRGARGIAGINLGANKDAPDRIADYVTGIVEAAPFADYMTINISSPNTPGLRALQSKGALDELLGRAVAARGQRKTPLFLKVAPDVTDADIGDISVAAIAAGIDGLIVSNTTTERPASLRGRHSNEVGGLSGRPLFVRSTEVLSAFRQATVGALPLIGVGGISSADDAYAKIRAGASLVQVYTGFIYRGPQLVSDIKNGLAAHLIADGFETIADAVGADG